MIYCYGRILWVLTRRIDSTLNDTVNKGDTFLLARKNTIKSFILVAVCFTICWAFNVVFNLKFFIGYKVDWSGTYYKFTILMVFLNCTVNPFIYLIKYQDFQKALKKSLGYFSDNSDRSTNVSSSGATFQTGNESCVY